MVGVRSWSDLPIEILEQIIKGLDSDIYVLRFQAVCTSWRATRNLLKRPPTISFPLKLPYLLRSHNFDRDAHRLLSQSTVYLIQPPQENETQQVEGWLVKVQEGENGKLIIRSPVSQKIIKNVKPFPKVLNMLDFRVTEICKSYTLNYRKRNHKFYTKKVVLLWSSSTEFDAMVIDSFGGLWYLKSGDDMWTKLLDGQAFDDVIEYNKQFYVVDRYGETLVFHLDMFYTVSHAICGSGRMNKLVESAGHLFLVNMVLNVDEINYPMIGNRVYNSSLSHISKFQTVHEIEIYLLDKKYYCWERVKNLQREERIWFVGNDCSFSVSSKDFGHMCKGNCIYYANDEKSSNNNRVARRNHLIQNDALDEYASDDILKDLNGHKIGVFDLDDVYKIGSLLLFPEFAKIFWPPPPWLMAN